jgi:hypothetical protein
LKKFLIGFGSFLILFSVFGIINHLSMIIKAAQEEQDMYGDSVYFMVIQLSSTMGPFITSLIGGGIILALVAFLNEYQKRSEITTQLIQVLSEQRFAPPKQETKEPLTKYEDHQITNSTDTTSKKDTSIGYEDERFYWNG